MAGIAGIAQPNQCSLVSTMLSRISHRGGKGQLVFSTSSVTLGMVTNQIHGDFQKNREQKRVQDGYDEDRFAIAQEDNSGLLLKRDPLGVAPLYYGFREDGVVCFASEVKGLLGVTKNVRELAPGSIFSHCQETPYYTLPEEKPLEDSAEIIATKLFTLLEQAVHQKIHDSPVGCWLSGGLDSSIIASLLQKKIKNLHTFSVGIDGAADLQYAQEMSHFLNSQHHEVKVTMNDIRRILPQVIYHLESFDPLLVRSSIMHFIAAREASHYVRQVFSGEGSDELFGGYDFFQSLSKEELPQAIRESVKKLHHTALQRVDRCAAVFGLEPALPFLARDVVHFALRIPTRLKIHHGVEKWILRVATREILPPSITQRKKAKFWQGAGIENALAKIAAKAVSDWDFQRERMLPNGWTLNSKEELFYYRIFQEHYGTLQNCDWVGRTEEPTPHPGTPSAPAHREAGASPLPPE